MILIEDLHGLQWALEQAMNQNGRSCCYRGPDSSPDVYSLCISSTEHGPKRITILSLEGSNPTFFTWANIPIKINGIFALVKVCHRGPFALFPLRGSTGMTKIAQALYLSALIRTFIWPEWNSLIL